MIVVDSNIIVYLHISSEFSSWAEKALMKDPSWASPLLWRSEMLNVLAHYIRKKYLSFDQACAIMEEAVCLMTGREYDVLASDVLRLSVESDCTAYDCEFVALALNLGAPLVTMDKQILSAFPDVAVALDKFTAI
jgi:predicted nucleic acid-binding protein